MDELIKKAQQAITQADAIIILAGAGMGVDSGLPDFRGNEGFWRAYPKLKDLNYQFEDIANPQAFNVCPEIAWGFYGHRLNLYRDTVPHEGFSILKKWCDSMPQGYFIFTSNVDGQFQKAGFDENRIYECHGSIHHLQSVHGIGEITSAKEVEIKVDEQTLKAQTLPHNDKGELLRPNILMFDDWYWQKGRSAEQRERYNEFFKPMVRTQQSKVVLIELGAGTAIPTVQMESAKLKNWLNATYIQINPKLGRKCTIGLNIGALEALRLIDKV